MSSMQDTIRRLTIVAEDRGIDQTAAKLDKLSAAQAGVAVTAQQTERAQQSIENAFTRAQRKYDEVARAQMEMAKVERLVTQARMQSIGTEAERIRLLDAATAAINRRTTALGRMHQAEVANDNSAAGRRQVLGYQAFDVGQGLAAGTPLAIIAAQQGPQIAQLYAAQGGLNALWKDGISLLGGLVRAAGPWVAVLAALYGAYKLLASYSVDSALQIDAATRALVDQAAPIGTVQSGIGELARLQKTYQDTIRATGDVHSSATDKIIANTKREFEARKALLELEAIRQEAALKANQAAIAQQSLELRRGISGDLGPWYNPYGGSNGVNTRMDLERRGFADPRIGSVPFVQLPDDITGIERTQEIIDKSPVFQKLRELRAEGELTRLTFEALQEALKATFDGQQLIKDGTPTNTSGLPLTMTPPGFRGIDDQPGSLQFYEDAIKLGERRILQLQQERQMIGLVGAELAAAEYVQRLVNDAVAKNIQLSPEQVAALKDQAIAIGRIVDLNATLKLQQDLLFEREQLFRSTSEQSIAARLRGTGLGSDSEEARWMRDNQRFTEAKEFADGFLTTFQQELLKNGGDIGEAFGKAILNAATNSMNKQFEAIFDRLASWFASWLTGIKPGSGLGGAAASAIGGVVGANDNTVAPVGASAIAEVGGGVFNTVGNYRAGVDAKLTDILKTAAERSGRRVDAFSGYRPGDPRFHGKGMATDIRLFDDAGNALANYQNAGAFREYEKFAQTARAVQLEKYPELNDKFRWGGYFSGEKGKYGAMDTMHFDVGGAGMKGGSWESGLTAKQRALFPGAESVGMGQASSSLQKLSSSADKLTTGFSDLNTGVTNAVGKVTEMGAKWFGSDEMWKGLASPDFKPNTTLSAILGYGGSGGGATGGGGGLGFLGSLFSSIFSLFGFANGTENAPAGWAWVGERGPELRKLRAGDVIRSNARSQQMAANNSNGRPAFSPVFNIDARGSTMTRAEFEQIARQQSQAALSEYHDAQVAGGFGETQRAYSSQKG